MQNLTAIRGIGGFANFKQIGAYTISADHFSNGKAILQDEFLHKPPIPCILRD